VRRIGFTYNPYSDRAPALLDRARAWCASRDVATWDAPGDGYERIVAELEATDFVCVLGGDGTFLRTARAIGGSGVPALGVNVGRIGFLAKVEPEGLEGALDQVAAGDYRAEDRFRIRARLVRAHGDAEEHSCLNEVVVARGSRVRMIRLEVEVSRSHLATYVADGVVVRIEDVVAKSRMFGPGGLQADDQPDRARLNQSEVLRLLQWWPQHVRVAKRRSKVGLEIRLVG